MIKHTSMYFEPYKLAKEQERFIKECKSLLKACNYNYLEKIKYKVKKMIRRIKNDN